MSEPTDVIPEVRSSVIEPAVTAARRDLEARFSAVPSELELTAIHEAGHVAAAIACGASALSATIKPGGATPFSPAYLGRMSHWRLPEPREEDCLLTSGWARHYCTIRMAGTAASQLLVPDRDTSLEQGGDLYWTEMLVETLLPAAERAVGVPRYLDQTRGLAQAVLLRPPVWRMVIATAELLLDRETLSGPELLKALTGGRCGAVHPSLDDRLCTNPPHHAGCHWSYRVNPADWSRESYEWDGLAPTPSRKSRGGPAPSALRRKVIKINNRVPVGRRARKVPTYPTGLMSVAEPSESTSRSPSGHAARRLEAVNSFLSDFLGPAAVLGAATTPKLLEAVLRAAAGEGVDIKTAAAEVSIAFSKSATTVVHDAAGRIDGVFADRFIAECHVEGEETPDRALFTSSSQWWERTADGLRLFPKGDDPTGMFGVEAELEDAYRTYAAACEAGRVVPVDERKLLLEWRVHHHGEGRAPVVNCGRRGCDRAREFLLNRSWELSSASVSHP